MIKYFFIAGGGALGAVFRYLVSGFVYRFFAADFPWGTLIVNLAGSLLIGLLWGAFEVIMISQNMRLFLFIGILGAFTTFSTFSLESFNLLRDGEYGFFCWNIILSVVLGITLVTAGYVFSKFLINGLR